MKKTQITAKRALAILPFWLLTGFSLCEELARIGSPYFLSSTFLTFSVAAIITFVILTGEGG
jgi:hypothetical protein